MPYLAGRRLLNLGRTDEVWPRCAKRSARSRTTARHTGRWRAPTGSRGDFASAIRSSSVPSSSTRAGYCTATRTAAGVGRAGMTGRSLQARGRLQDQPSPATLHCRWSARTGVLATCYPQGRYDDALRGTSARAVVRRLQRSRAEGSHRDRAHRQDRGGLPSPGRRKRRGSSSARGDVRQPAAKGADDPFTCLHRLMYTPADREAPRRSGGRGNSGATAARSIVIRRGAAVRAPLRGGSAASELGTYQRPITKTVELFCHPRAIGSSAERGRLDLRG